MDSLKCIEAIYMNMNVDPKTHRKLNLDIWSDRGIVVAYSNFYLNSCCRVFLYQGMLFRTKTQCKLNLGFWSDCGIVVLYLRFKLIFELML